MPLFPFFKSKKLADPQKTIIYKEVGQSGTQFFSGFIYGEEYLSELSGSEGLDKYDKMRRSDATIQGILNALVLPILQTRWFIEPGSDSPQDTEIAEIISNNLFEDMSITWQNFLRQALGMFWAGFSLFEKILQLKDGFYLLRKLAPRLQKTIYSWETDKNGGFKGVDQLAQNGEGKYAHYKIPADKLLLFINEQEGSNFAGKSLLRGAYRNWYVKNELIKIDAIGHDRFSSGVPWAKLPVGANATDKTNASEILSKLYSREKSYMRIPADWEIGIFEKTSSNDSLIQSIKYHDEEMSKSVLAQFIHLGTSQTGSRALGNSFEELFLMSLNAVAKSIEDTINKYSIQPIVNMNWTVEEYPHLRHRRILLNAYNWITNVADAQQKGLLTHDVDIENSARELLGVTELDPEEFAAKEEEKKKIAEQICQATVPAQVPAGGQVQDEEEDLEDQQANMMSEKMLSDKKRRRELTEAEKVLADFDKIEITLDEGVDRYEKQIKKIRQQQASVISQDVVNKAPDKIKVPFIGKLADRLFEENKRAFVKGRLAVKDELSYQRKQSAAVKTLAEKPKPLKDPYDEDEIEKHLKDKANADAVRLSNNVLGAGLFSFYHIDQTNKTKAQLTQDIYNDIADTGIREISLAAEGAITNAYSLGREMEAQENNKDIEYAIYSAILDDNVCEVCLSKDGVQHDVDDYEWRAPNQDDCLGKDRCRCINIYKLKEMQGEFVTKSIIDYNADKSAPDLDREKDKYVTKI